jgi:hypothetical protein
MFCFHLLVIKDNPCVSSTLDVLASIQETVNVESVRRRICAFWSEKNHGAGDCFDVLHSDKGVVLTSTKAVAETKLNYEVRNGV